MQLLSEDGGVALNSSQIAKTRAAAAKLEKYLNETVATHCQEMLENALIRSKYKNRFAFGTRNT